MLNRLYGLFLLLYTRVLCLIFRNITIGDGSVVNPTACISTPYIRGGVSIGKNCGIGTRRNSYIIGHYHPTRIYVRTKNARIIIGDNVNLNGVYISARLFIRLGNNCRIASGSQILDYNGHVTYSTDRTKGVDQPAPVIIGNNVWIGLNAIILKGTEIGDNSIVSAGSVVKGIFPPNSLITGNPAVVVKILNIHKA